MLWPTPISEYEVTSDVKVGATIPLVDVKFPFVYVKAEGSVRESLVNEETGVSFNLSTGVKRGIFNAGLFYSSTTTESSQSSSAGIETKAGIGNSSMKIRFGHKKTKEI
ncbi:MAG: hypothetical protein ACJATI_005042 [Halioglobus sp.]|jgi:hypothetical protein